MVCLVEAGVEIVGLNDDSDREEIVHVLFHQYASGIHAGRVDGVAWVLRAVERIIGAGVGDLRLHSVLYLIEDHVGEEGVYLAICQHLVFVLPGRGKPQRERCQAIVRDMPVVIAVEDLPSGDRAAHAERRKDAEGLEVKVKSLCFHTL